MGKIIGNGKIDLHMHSYYSDDGEFSPSELVRKCKKQGIELMAVADHNSVRANEEARQAAKKEGIAYISAIEIDCTFLDVNFHLLGYGIDDRSADFYSLEEKIAEQSAAISCKMLSATRKLGFEVTENDMAELSKGRYWKDRWTGEMFAEVLLDRPEYREHPLLKPYRPGGERSDNPYVNFYWDYYSQGKPCFAAIAYMSLQQAVDMIHRNGGRAVLAHPEINLKGRNELLDPMIEQGIDGIEVFSSYHTAAQAEYFYRQAQKHDLMVTCGSDYHGKTKPSVQLGKTGNFLDEQVIGARLCKEGLIDSRAAIVS